MNRNHPIRLLLDDSAFTGKPRTVGDVDAALDRYLAGLTVQLSSTKRDELRRQLLDAGHKVAALRAEGSNQSARETAIDLASTLANHGDWTTPATPLDTLDPAELAKAIPQH